MTSRTRRYVALGRVVSGSMKRSLGLAVVAAAATLTACSSAPSDANTVTLTAPPTTTLAADDRPGATLDVLTGTTNLSIKMGNPGTGAARCIWNARPAA